MKHIFSLVAVFALIFSSATAASAAETAEDIHQLEQKNFPLYLFSPEAKVSEEFPLYFADGADDLPFIDLQDWVDLLNMLQPGSENPYLTVWECEEGSIVNLIRDNGSIMSCDFAKDTILFDDYVAFQQDVGTLYIDVATLPAAILADNSFILCSTDSRERRGNSTLMNLKEYGIPMIAQDGKYLLPLQTISFVTLSESGIGTYFNGESVILSVISVMKDPQVQLMQRMRQSGLVTEELMDKARENAGSYGEMAEYIAEALSQTTEGRQVVEAIREEQSHSLYALYASVPKGQRSSALAEYGYEELCLELDYQYGLKESHHIDDFFVFLTQAGLTERLLGPDADAADAAVGELTEYWFDDGHSGFNAPSHLATGNSEWETGLGMLADSAKSVALEQVRSEYPEASLPYYEVGDTAFVTFDVFSVAPPSPGSAFADYYELDGQDALPDDTFGLIIRAHREITRENSPIKNVVIDLSDNTGGAAPAAVFVLCWALGDAQTSVVYTDNDAEATVSYRADVNLDHVFDEKDSISGLNVYCLTSSQSFSCGNLVPWAFKADGRVTLLGKVTGGGSCVVRPMVTAWGASYQISGAKRISFVKNGAYYDVDRGVDPDFIIQDYHHFYDREALTEFIHNLY